MEWLQFQRKKHSRTHEVDKAKKRVEELHQTRAFIQSVTSDNQKLQDESSFLAQEIQILTEYRKTKIKPLLLFEQDRLRKLESLQRVQSKALEASLKQVEKEDAYCKASENIKTERYRQVEVREEQETGWIVECLSSIDKSHKMESEYTKIDQVKTQISLLKDQFTQVRRAAVDKSLHWRTKRSQFQQNCQLLQKGLEAIMEKIQSERNAILKKKQAFERQQQWKDLMNEMERANEETELDREIPWIAENYVWEHELNITAHSFILGSDQRVEPKTILSCLRPASAPMTLLVKHMPHAKGTFRRAYYAMDLHTGRRYVLKHFHIRRGIERDFEDCKRVSKMYAFTKYCAALFENELFSAQQLLFAQEGGNRRLLENHVYDIHSITYVSSYYARVPSWFDDSQEETAIMIEPFVPTFCKWINNDILEKSQDSRDAFPHVEALSTFVHWTYQRSERAFIIADLQGFKCMVPLNITSNDIEAILPHAIPCNETDLSYGERVIKWLLSDPAIHYLYSSSEKESSNNQQNRNHPFALELKECLQIDFDGNLGLEAETMLKEKHVCGQMCRMLGLFPL